MAAACASPVCAADTPARQPVPAAERAAAVAAELPGLFEAEWTSAQAGGAPAAALAGKLRATGRDAKDPVERYVLFREALTQALAGGDLREALDDLALLRAEFDLRGEVLIKEAFDRLAKARLPKAPEFDALVAGLAGNQAVITLDAATQKTLFDTLAATGRRLNAADSMATLTQVRREIETQAKAAQALAAARETLASNPKDPAANLAVAKDLITKSAPADQVLPLLANIADAKVAAAAKAQVAFSGDRSSLMALFEAWAGACESRDVDLANYGLTMLNSAGTTLLADATGLEKAKIEKRIATAQARVEATAKASGGSAVVAGGSLVAHLERVNGLKPTVLLGNIEKNLQVSGLVILEQGSSVQGGTTITAAPGTVFVMRGAMDINWSNVILNQENGLPVAFIAGSDRRLILSNDNKPLRNLMIYSEYMWEFPSISGNVMDSCIFIGNSSEREKSHFYPGFRKISNSIIVNSLTGANVLEKTQNCMFVDCNLGLSKQQSGQNIEIPCWLVGSPLPEELKKALWVDANRVTLKVNPGRPTLPYAAEAGRLLPALKAIADKHQVPRR